MVVYVFFLVSLLARMCLSCSVMLRFKRNLKKSLLSDCGEVISVSLPTFKKTLSSVPKQINPRGLFSGALPAQIPAMKYNIATPLEPVPLPQDVSTVTTRTSQECSEAASPSADNKVKGLFAKDLANEKEVESPPYGWVVEGGIHPRGAMKTLHLDAPQSQRNTQIQGSTTSRKIRKYIREAISK